ncbi:hypothetical protein SESBI_20411 [Sesbania bispinosa]|nr:hypothetical protein SESBI_20411 [Sesbania bispinosa]
MENLLKPSREEEDLIGCSTEKIKLGVDGIKVTVTSESEVVVFPDQDPSLSPKRKPFYKDIATAADRMEEDPNEIVRAVMEDLYPDLEFSDHDRVDPKAFNPNPEIKISHEEFEDWCNLGVIRSSCGFWENDWG